MKSHNDAGYIYLRASAMTASLNTVDKEITTATLSVFIPKA